MHQGVGPVRVAVTILGMGGRGVNPQSFSPYRPPGQKPNIPEGARGEEREKAAGGKGGLKLEEAAQTASTGQQGCWG